MSSYAVYKTTALASKESLDMEEFHQAELEQDRLGDVLTMKVHEINATLGIVKSHIPPPFDNQRGVFCRLQLES